MKEPRITWFRGKPRGGPSQTIGVLEIRGDGTCRAVFGDRTELDGGTHIRLAREAWGWKDSLDTRWWSLVLDRNHQASTVRNGSCGDALTRADVPMVVRALDDLGLLTERTMISVDDDGPAVFPRLRKAAAQLTPRLHGPAAPGASSS